MICLTITLLVAGAILAAVGTLGFCYVARTAPDPHDLAYTRRMATIGRQCIYAGIASIVATDPLLASLALVGFAAAASHLTRAPLRNVPRRAAP